MNENIEIVINDFCAPLPFDLKKKIINEHENRMREVKYFVENTDFYAVLDNDFEIVELILALTIYYKRVLMNLDSAVKFYGKVTSISQANSISIGKFQLDNSQKNKLLGVLINFRKIMEKYSIPPYLFEYLETKEFLRKVVEYKKSFEINNEKRN